MNFLGKYIIISFIGALVFLTSCSEFNKIQKSNDSQQKYEYAKGLYEKQEYTKALLIFDQLYAFFRGKDKAEELNYLMAYSYYHNGDYEMASYYFKTYARLFPGGQHAEEATYMSAYSKAVAAPYYKLDQTDTKTALKEMQLFINYYPNSSYLEEANKQIDLMRNKLAVKAFEIAKTYYKRRIYLSAMIAFDNMVKDFPESTLREEAMFLGLKSSYLYAHNSVKGKQEERYRKAKELFDRFQRNFPESQYIEQAKEYHEIILTKF